MHKNSIALQRESTQATAARETQLPWKKALLASAAALSLWGMSAEVQALALGAITVRSALGEPLRAEIEVPQISSEEAASFQANLASPEAFRAAGVDYSPALAGARVSLQRRPNGQAYLRLVSDRPVNEPFLGVVIEANWDTGRVVRDYTMLVDPPARLAAQTPAPARPQAAPVAPAPQPPVVAEQVARPSAVSRPAATRPAAAAPTRGGASNGAGQVTIQRGDTAYRIASRNLPDGVSLDQMLMAMLRANPHAFIRGNVNLMKAGAVMDLPGAEQAQAMSRGEASRTVAAQTRDFQAYRRGLAQNAPVTQVEAASRSASGQVGASVQEGTSAPAADRLTISKGAADAASAPGQAETGLAQSRQADEQAERIAELKRNIEELSRLQGTLPAGAQESSTGAPSITVPAGQLASASAAAAADSASTDGAAVGQGTDDTAGVTTGDGTVATTAGAAATAGAASATDSDTASGADSAASAASAAAIATAAEAASIPASAATPPAAPAPVARPAPMSMEEPSFIDTLRENPMLPIAGAGLLALLAAYGVYRSRQNKKNAAPLDSTIAESRPQSDSFFGSSGGQHVDTTSEKTVRPAAPTSLMYSPSQIDTAGDVDPVAEADVYLAYGRDMQAEEILKEALRTHPGKISIQRKLVEIYAKRRDARAVEAVATEIHAATGGQGADWSFVREQGRKLDPDNALYALADLSSSAGSESLTPRPGFSEDTSPMSTRLLDDKLQPSELPSLDLDLNDVSAPPPAPSRTGATTAEAGAAGLASLAGAAALARGSSTKQTSDGPESPATPKAVAAAELAPLDFDLSLDPDPAPDKASAPQAPKTVTGMTAGASPAKAPDLDDFSAEQTRQDGLDSGMIEFDLEALSVDPDSRSSDLKTEQPDDADDDPLSTKLALAREFHAIGDTEGALSLIKEVVAEASGPVKARAERFLRELS